MYQEFLRDFKKMWGESTRPNPGTPEYTDGVVEVLRHIESPYTVMTFLRGAMSQDYHFLEEHIVTGAFTDLGLGSHHITETLIKLLRSGELPVPEFLEVRQLHE